MVCNLNALLIKKPSIVFSIETFGKISQYLKIERRPNNQIMEMFGNVFGYNFAYVHRCIPITENINIDKYFFYKFEEI